MTNEKPRTAKEIAQYNRIAKQFARYESSQVIKPKNALNVREPESPIMDFIEAHRTAIGFLLIFLFIDLFSCLYWIVF